MEKIIYTFEDLKTIEELEFFKTEGLLINGVSLFGIDTIFISIICHDLISIRFNKNQEEVASLLLTKNQKLEVNNNNIFYISKKGDYDIE